MPHIAYTAKTLPELLAQIKEHAKERYEATYFEQWMRLTEVAEALEPLLQDVNEKETK